MTAKTEFLKRPDGSMLAYDFLAGRGPGILFCGGFRSDMTGTKASALRKACERTGRAFTRFDYFAHGQSPGDFLQGSISRWRDDGLAVLDEITQGPQIIVGSSMGGWIMLLMTLMRPERIKALVGIASAPDFTEDLMWAQYDETARAAILRDGVYHEPSIYSDDPYSISRLLIEDGRKNLLLREPIAIHCPVRLLHGTQDQDVPWQFSERLMRQLQSSDVTLTLVKDGDHRLSNPNDLDLLIRTLESLT